MIIKLLGADFSENNIGTITFDRKVTPETEALLENYTRVFTKDQKLAVQDFIDDLKTYGIWSNIDNLYIPALAGAVGESFFNVKTKTLDFSAESAYYTLDSFGVKSVSGDSAVAEEHIAKAVLGGSRMDYHFMAYINPITMGEENTWYCPIILNNSGVQGGLRMTTIPATGKLSVSSYSFTSLTIQDYTMDGAVSGFVGISSGQDKVIGLVDNSDSGLKNVIEADDTTFTGLSAYIGYQWGRKPLMGTGMRIISTGRVLTSSQLSKFNELCDALDEIIAVS